MTNLVKNYTPHLKPNTRSAPPTSELRRLLAVAARDMLTDYLRKWKNKATYSREPLSKEMSQVRRSPSNSTFENADVLLDHRYDSSETFCRERRDAGAVRPRGFC